MADGRDRSAATKGRRVCARSVSGASAIPEQQFSRFLRSGNDAATPRQQLDRAVERCYRKEPFTSDRQRVEYLFALYEQLVAP